MVQCNMSQQDDYRNHKLQLKMTSGVLQLLDANGEIISRTPGTPGGAIVAWHPVHFPKECVKIGEIEIDGDRNDVLVPSDAGLDILSENPVSNAAVTAQLDLQRVTPSNDATGSETEKFNAITINGTKYAVDLPPEIAGDIKFLGDVEINSAKVDTNFSVLGASTLDTVGCGDLTTSGNVVIGNNDTAEHMKDITVHGKGSFDSGITFDGTKILDDDGTGLKYNGTVVGTADNCVLKAGDTMSGNLTIEKDTPTLQLKTTTSNHCGVAFTGSSSTLASYIVEPGGDAYFTHRIGTAPVLSGNMFKLKSDGGFLIRSKSSDAATDYDMLLGNDGSLTVPGSIVQTVDQALVKNNDSGALAIQGGSGDSKGARLSLSGKDRTGGYAGMFTLRAYNGTNDVILTGKPDGTLTWGSNDISGTPVSYNISAGSGTNISIYRKYCYKIGRMVFVSISGKNNSEIAEYATSVPVFTGLPAPIARWDLGVHYFDRNTVRGTRFQLDTNGRIMSDSEGFEANFFSFNFTYISAS